MQFRGRSRNSFFTPSRSKYRCDAPRVIGTMQRSDATDSAEAHMDTDDILRGRLLTRREVLALFGAAGLAAAVGCSDCGSSRSTPTTGRAAAATGAPSRAATSAANAAAGA